VLYLAECDRTSSGVLPAAKPKDSIRFSKKSLPRSVNGAVFSKQIKIPPGFNALKQFLTAISLVPRSK
jgi:hypothetical protein